MIERFYRNLATGRYLAQSENYKKILQICSEIRASFENYLKEHVSAEAIDYMLKYPDRVAVQNDIDLSYNVQTSWRWRSTIFNNNMLIISLNSLNLPRVFPSVSNMFGKDSSFDKDFTAKIDRRLKELDSLANNLIPELEALENALSEKSMNKTSIKEYYPELYNLIYND